MRASVKVKTHTSVMENKCVKKYPDPICSEELWPKYGFWVCVHLDLGDMTFGQGHYAPLGHGQQVCELLSRSNFAVRSYGPGTDFRYNWTVTLTLVIRPCNCVQVMTHPGVMDNKCETYILIQLRSEENVPDSYFRYMCIAALTLEMWPWVKVLTHPWIMDN